MKLVDSFSCCGMMLMYQFDLIFCLKAKNGNVGKVNWEKIHRCSRVFAVLETEEKKPAAAVLY